MTEQNLKILNTFKEKAVKMIEKNKNNNFNYIGNIFFYKGRNFMNFEVGKIKVGLTIAYGDISIALDRSNLSDPEIRLLSETFVQEGYVLKRFNYHKKIFNKISESKSDEAVDICEKILFTEAKLVERLYNMFN